MRFTEVALLLKSLGRVPGNFDILINYSQGSAWLMAVR